MKTYYATFFVGEIVLIKPVQAYSMEQGADLCRRFATAASVSTKDIYQYLDIYEAYPDQYVLNEAQVSDLEYLSRKMKGGRG